MQATKTTQTAVDFELEIKCELMEVDDSVRKKAINKLFNAWGKNIASYLQRKFWYLDDDRRTGALLDAFMNLYDAVKKPGFDFEDALMKFLMDLAKKRCIDEARKLRPTETTDDEFIMSVASNLKDTTYGNLWNEITSRGIAAEIQVEFRIFVQTLSERQRLVANAMMEFYPDYFESRLEIIDWIFERSGIHLTDMQVKRDFQTIRAKFKEILNKYNHNN